MSLIATSKFETDVVRVEEGAKTFPPFETFSTPDTLKSVKLTYATSSSTPASFVVPTNLPTGWTAGTQDGNSITLNAAEAGAVSIDSVIGAIQLQTNDPGSLETVGVQVVSDQMNTSTLVDIYSAVGKDEAFLNNIVAEAAQTEDNWDKWANGNKAEATGAFLSYQMTGTFGLTPDGTWQSETSQPFSEPCSLLVSDT